MKIELDFSEFLSVSLRRGLNVSIPLNGFVLRISEQYHFVPGINKKCVLSIDTVL